MERGYIPMSRFVKEFKEFAFKGNVIDMAVGVMIGGAFSNIVTSVVNDLFTPLLATLTGSVNFSALAIVLGSGENAPVLAVGNFIQTVINFLIIALCIFMFVKFVNRLRRPSVEAPAPAPRICPFCRTEIPEEAIRCPHCTSQLDG